MKLESQTFREKKMTEIKIQSETKTDYSSLIMPAGTVDAGCYQYEIKGTETDFMDRLHISALLSMMQEAAYQNAQSLNIGAGYLDPMGICWLLSKISVRVEKLPRWLDDITVCTWSRGPRRLLFLRDYTFYQGGIDSNNIIGHAATEWFLAQSEGHRPIRPDQVISADLIASHQRAPAAFDFSCPKLKNLDISTSEEPILTKFADFSDIDRNGHVNNTRYSAWAVDALQAWLGKSSGKCQLMPVYITGLDIQYICEVKFGSRVDLYVKSEVETSILAEGRIHNSEQVVFRARVFYMKSEQL